MAIIGNNYFIRKTIFGERQILGFHTDDFGSIPQITYKYLNLSIDHNRNSLIEDYLWFSDPTTFNDPFDCKVSFAYHLLADDEEYCRRYYESLSLLREPYLSNDQRKRAVDQNVKRIVDNKSNIELFKRFEEASQTERLGGIRQFGIFCSCMINDNILLWSHYANNHKGVCLGLNVYNLLERYYANGQMGTGEVKYDHYPQIRPILLNDDEAIINTFQPFFLHKAPFWDYELEYRFLDYPCIDRKKLMGDIIDSIYMGCDISYEDEQFIKEVCKNRQARIKLYKAEKAFFKYEIEFKEVAY